MSKFAFGLEVHSPWPEPLPKGRLFAPKCRYVNLAHTDDVEKDFLLSIISTIPKPAYSTGFVGLFKQCLFIPAQRPNYVAWEADFLNRQREIGCYQLKLKEWLAALGLISTESRRFWQPYVVMARNPDLGAWQDSFIPLPFCTSLFKLYQITETDCSPLWSYPQQRPFLIERSENIVHIQVFSDNEQFLGIHMLGAIAYLSPALTTSLWDSPVFLNLKEYKDYYNQLLKNLLPKDFLAIKRIISIEKLEYNLYIIKAEANEAFNPLLNY